MCGIAGFVDFKKNSTVELLRAMTDAMLHRGPDDGGHEVYEAGQASIGFGQRRLSILDLSPLGHQPMHFGDLIVNFNGEIYNFKEIRQELVEKGYSFDSWSDTEVILKGYHCWGMDVVQKFIGTPEYSQHKKKRFKSLDHNVEKSGTYLLAELNSIRTRRSSFGRA